MVLLDPRSDEEEGQRRRGAKKRGQNRGAEKRGREKDRELRGLCESNVWMGERNRARVKREGEAVQSTCIIQTCDILSYAYQWTISCAVDLSENCGLAALSFPSPLVFPLFFPLSFKKREEIGRRRTWTCNDRT